MRGALLLLLACGSPRRVEKQVTPPPPSADVPVLSPVTPKNLPAGPVPVALAQVPDATLRTLGKTDGFMTMDAGGAVTWGLVSIGAAPYAGHALQRGDSVFAHLFMRDQYGPDDTVFRLPASLEYDLDAYAKLTAGATTRVVILADGATPAFLLHRHGIREFGYHKVALAVGAANTASLYEFGGEPWDKAELTLRVGALDALAGATPKSVLLQYTEQTTTSELLAALDVIAKAGVEDLRLHRMFGWGGVPVAEIESVAGPVADDDRFAGDPIRVEVAEPVTTGALKPEGTSTALSSFSPRFRYCFEMHHKPKLRGAILLSFDVAATGAISNAKATGLDPDIASCIAGSIHDLDISGRSLGAGHATVQISLNLPETTRSPSGFWCWTHDAQSFCSRERWQCDAQLGTPIGPLACKAQKSAWTSDDRAFWPTKALCGATCRLVK